MKSEEIKTEVSLVTEDQMPPSTCDNCFILGKKLERSRSWNRFFKEKLINIDKVLHILGEFEYEKQKYLELQLIFDERNRELELRRDQLIDCYKEMQPLKDRLEEAERDAAKCREESIKHEIAVKSLQLMIDQLQAKIRDMHSISNPLYAENLEKKLFACRAENKKLRNNVECNNVEVSELRTFISSKHNQVENLNKKLYKYLNIAKRYGEFLPKDSIEEDWDTIIESLKEVTDTLHSHFITFRDEQIRRLKGRRLERSFIPAFDKWVDVNFEFKLESTVKEEHHSDDELSSDADLEEWKKMLTESEMDVKKKAPVNKEKGSSSGSVKKLSAKNNNKKEKGIPAVSDKDITQKKENKHILDDSTKQVLSERDKTIQSQSKEDYLIAKAAIPLKKKAIEKEREVPLLPVRSFKKEASNSQSSKSIHNIPKNSYDSDEISQVSDNNGGTYRHSLNLNDVKSESFSDKKLVDIIKSNTTKCPDDKYISDSSSDSDKEEVLCYRKPSVRRRKVSHKTAKKVLDTDSKSKINKVDNTSNKLPMGPPVGLGHLSVKKKIDRSSKPSCTTRPEPVKCNLLEDLQITDSESEMDESFNEPLHRERKISGNANDYHASYSTSNQIIDNNVEVVNCNKKLPMAPPTHAPKKTGKTVEGDSRNGNNYHSSSSSNNQIDDQNIEAINLIEKLPKDPLTFTPKKISKSVKVDGINGNNYHSSSSTSNQIADQYIEANNFNEKLQRNPPTLTPKKTINSVEELDCRNTYNYHTSTSNQIADQNIETVNCNMKLPIASPTLTPKEAINSVEEVNSRNTNNYHTSTSNQIAYQNIETVNFNKKLPMASLTLTPKKTINSAEEVNSSNTNNYHTSTSNQIDDQNIETVNCNNKLPMASPTLTPKKAINSVEEVNSRNANNSHTSCITSNQIADQNIETVNFNKKLSMASPTLTPKKTINFVEMVNSRNANNSHTSCITSDQIADQNLKAFYLHEKLPMNPPTLTPKNTSKSVEEVDCRKQIQLIMDAMCISPIHFHSKFEDEVDFEHTTDLPKSEPVKTLKKSSVLKPRRFSQGFEPSIELETNHTARMVTRSRGTRVGVSDDSPAEDNPTIRSFPKRKLRVSATSKKLKDNLAHSEKESVVDLEVEDKSLSLPKMKHDYSPSLKLEKSLMINSCPEASLVAAQINLLKNIAVEKGSFVEDKSFSSGASTELENTLLGSHKSSCKVSCCTKEELPTETPVEKTSEDSQSLPNEHPEERERPHSSLFDLSISKCSDMEDSPIKPSNNIMLKQNLPVSYKRNLHRLFDSDSDDDDNNVIVKKKFTRFKGKSHKSDLPKSKRIRKDSDIVPTRESENEISAKITNFSLTEMPSEQVLIKTAENLHLLDSATVKAAPLNSKHNHHSCEKSRMISKHGKVSLNDHETYRANNSNSGSVNDSSNAFCKIEVNECHLEDIVISPSMSTDDIFIQRGERNKLQFDSPNKMTDICLPCRSVQEKDGSFLPLSMNADEFQRSPLTASVSADSNGKGSMRKSPKNCDNTNVSLGSKNTNFFVSDANMKNVSSVVNEEGDSHVDDIVASDCNLVVTAESDTYSNCSSPFDGTLLMDVSPSKLVLDDCKSPSHYADTDLVSECDQDYNQNSKNILSPFSTRNLKFSASENMTNLTLPAHYLNRSVLQNTENKTISNEDISESSSNVVGEFDKPILFSFYKERSGMLDVSQDYNLPLLDTIQSNDEVEISEVEDECDEVSFNFIHHPPQSTISAVVGESERKCYEISNIVNRLLSTGIGTPNWQESLDRLFAIIDDKPFCVSSSKVLRVVRCVLCKLLQVDVFEKSINLQGIPDLFLKCLQISRLLEEHFHLPKFYIDNLVNMAAHKLILTKKLRPNCLASLTTWFTSSFVLQYNQIEPKHDEYLVLWCRTFLVDLLFHHVGTAQKAILAAINNSGKKAFIRMVKQRTASVLEAVIFWIIFYGDWEGDQITKTTLLEDVQKKIGYLKEPSKEPEHLIDEFTQILRDVFQILTVKNPDKDEKLSASSSLLLLLQWKLSSWTQKTFSKMFFTPLQEVLLSDQLSERADISQIKQLFSNLVNKCTWNEEAKNIFLSELEEKLGQDS